MSNGFCLFARVDRSPQTGWAHIWAQTWAQTWALKSRTWACPLARSLALVHRMAWTRISAKIIFTLFPF